MRVGIDAHMIGDHSGGNESFYTNIINNMNPPKNMEIILFVKKEQIYLLLQINLSV